MGFAGGHLLGFTSQSVCVKKAEKYDQINLKRTGKLNFLKITSIKLLRFSYFSAITLFKLINK